MVRTTIEYNEQDKVFLKEFQEKVQTLTGIVEETFVQNPVTLLHPVYRTMIVDLARDVEEMHAKIRRCRLFVDNLHEPLEEL